MCVLLPQKHGCKFQKDQSCLFEAEHVSAVFHPCIVRAVEVGCRKENQHLTLTEQLHLDNEKVNGILNLYRNAEVSLIPDRVSTQISE